MLKMKKKAYFFTLDAFIATGVIAVGIVLILFTTTNKPYEMQTAFLSQDLIDTISSIKVYQISDNNYIYELIEEGSITNPENTILDQIGEFSYRGMNDTASNFTKTILPGIIPNEYNFQLLIKEGDIIKFNYIKLKSIGTLRNTSKAVASSKNIIFGLSDSTMWGPYIAEVRTWK